MKLRQILIFTMAVTVVALVGVVLWFSYSDQADGAPRNISEIPAEYAIKPLRIGSPDAKVEVFEFASLTCPHCGQFHTQILPNLKKEYVNSGQVAFIYLDFPLDNLAYAASVFSRCVTEPLRERVIDMLYNTQNDWLGQQNPLASIVSSGRLIGIDENAYKACVNDGGILEAIQAEQQLGHDVFKVSGTPSIYVDGTKVEPAWDAIKLAIDEALGK